MTLLAEKVEQGMGVISNQIDIHYVELSDVPSNIAKHFNHDVACAKILTRLRISILKGIQEDSQLHKEMEAEKRRIEEAFQWLNQFWERHKEEFYDKGFRESPYTAHPLFGAYNQLSCEKAYLENPKQGNPFRHIDHTLNGKQTTGPLTIDNIAESIRHSIKDTKTALSKLESLGIIGRAFQNNTPPYWYWIEDEEYLR
jgi:DNA-binding transcriptional regulator GbsR (MarR family)